MLLLVSYISYQCLFICIYVRLLKYPRHQIPEVKPAQCVQQLAGAIESLIMYYAQMIDISSNFDTNGRMAIMCYVL